MCTSSIAATPRRRFCSGVGLPAVVGLLVTAMVGCASPGTPRPPSLQVPVLPGDVIAERVAGNVVVRIPVPQRSTDRLPLRPGPYRGVLCRSIAGGPCLATAAFTVDVSPAAAPKQGQRSARRDQLTLTDILSPDLATGPPRLLAYRVEIFSPSGISSGRSEPGFAAAGAAPPPVAGLTVAGSRAGAVLTWMPQAMPPPPPATGDVIISRQDLASGDGTLRHPDTLWFSANSGPSHPGTTLDSTLKPGTNYRYQAIRISRVSLNGHALELRSGPSATVDFALAQNLPPGVPVGLTAAGFADPGPPPAYAVDLIWQPVDDPGPATHTAAALAGYIVYREDLSGSGAPRVRLTASPVATPAYHDASALATQRYRYSVSSIDTAGNESATASVMVEPDAPQ